MSDHPDACRVLVRADQALVGETVRIALAARGLDVVDPELPRLRADVGLLITPLTTLRAVGEAQRVIDRSRLPWAVVSTTPRGPGWAAVHAAGARVVVDSSGSLEQVAEVLVAVCSGAERRDFQVSASLARQWEDVDARLRRVPRRELARWCRRDPGCEVSADDGAAFNELLQIETLL